MRIAVLSDAYLPEGTLNHAKMMHELAIELLGRGHEVVVITPGSFAQQSPVEKLCLNQVWIWKFRCRPMRGVSHIKRAVRETLLSWAAYRSIRRAGLDSRFDLVINYAPTIFFGPLAAWLKRNGAYVYLVLRDFFPQWAIDEGLIRQGSNVEKYFRFFEYWNYRVSDKIAVQSPANLPVFHEMVAPRPYPTEVLFNWGEVNMDVDAEVGRATINELGLSEKFVFFYGGNIGHAQDIPYILKLAEHLISYEEIHFLILGQGDQYKAIEGEIMSLGLSNTTLRPSVTQDEYRSLASQADVGLFTLSASHRAHNFPGKVLGYLAAGLPVLGAVNQDNDLIKIVNESKAGRVSVIGDFDTFVRDAVEIYSNSLIHSAMQENAINLLVERFSVARAADQILSNVQR